jgi:hypothetical protein
MLGTEVNEIINEFKQTELKGKSEPEIVKVFDYYCMKRNQTAIDGIKIGYLYCWMMIAGEAAIGLATLREKHKCGCGGC